MSALTSLLGRTCRFCCYYFYDTFVDKMMSTSYGTFKHMSNES